MRPARALLLPFIFAGTFSLWLTALHAQSASETPAISTSPSTAPSSESSLEGLWLTTDYPALTERMGEDIRLGLTLRNENLPPRRVELSVSGLPKNWAWQIEGAGSPVSAAYVLPNESRQLTLELTPPEDAKAGTYEFTVSGQTEEQTLSLPIAMSLAEAEAAEVTLEPELPALRGTPNSTFDFQIHVTNDSPEDRVFNLVAQAPAGFQVTFKEQYGTQELTSIPIKANESKDITLSVKPPQNVAAGQYEVVTQVGSAEVSGQTKLVLDVTGQPTLALQGPEGRLSGDATAGQERAFNFTLQNTGTAPAEDVKLTATAPTGWEVTFGPDTVPVIEAGQELEVTATIKPSERAIAGDYVVTMRANGDGASADAAFRVTVLTSTMWGIAGLGVIGAALLVLAVAVTRYGRR